MEVLGPIKYIQVNFTCFLCFLMCLLENLKLCMWLIVMAHITFLLDDIDSDVYLSIYESMSSGKLPKPIQFNSVLTRKCF